MEIYKRGNQYLELIETTSKSRGRYKCNVCGNVIEVLRSRVDSGHDKTCGCMSRGKSKRPKITLTKDGYAVTQTGLAIQVNTANGYLGLFGKYLHRCIAEKFIDNPNDYNDVNHKDGNKHNNSVDNLEWCSRSHNIKHAWDNGLNAGGSGQANKARAFTSEQIKYIRDSNLPSRKLGEELGVSKTTILNIRNKKIYKEVK
jgi:hypothetical protein